LQKNDRGLGKKKEDGREEGEVRRGGGGGGLSLDANGAEILS